MPRWLQRLLIALGVLLLIAVALVGSVIGSAFLGKTSIV